MGVVGTGVQKLAKGATRHIGIHFGDRFPFHYVSEYPKSGGTWLTRMVADYLKLPFPQRIKLPVAFACVLQNHWTHHPKLRPVVSLHRDGRDVINSYFYDRIRVARHADAPEASVLRKRYEKILGKNYDPDDIVNLLPRFMEYEFKHPGRGCDLNWADYVIGWHEAEPREGVVYASYEQLREDCVGTLSRIVEELTGKPADPWQVETTVEKFSFERQSGRKPGEASIASHARKGIVGDWRNGFSRESAEMFNDLAGDALVMLGYEADKNWVDKYEYVA